MTSRRRTLHIATPVAVAGALAGFVVWAALSLKNLPQQVADALNNGIDDAEDPFEV